MKFAGLVIAAAWAGLAGSSVAQDAATPEPARDWSAF